MKNIVPMTLILLMFASVFANTAWIEINENEMDGDANGRADDDVGILGILEPRATKTDTFTGELRNTVAAGEDVNFVVSVKNLGSNNVTEMNIIATIYLADMTVATDSSGNDLTWTDAVICDDSISCPLSSLAAGAYLDGGSYSVRDSSGSAIAWAAPLGAYTISIELDVMSGDEDITNDEFTVDITVVNWYDIGVDLEWSPVVEQAEGAGPHDFTLTVSTDGSDNWSARGITIDLMITGAALDTAVDGDGNNISGTTTHQAGNPQTVPVFFNESAPCGPGIDNIMGTADDDPCDPRNGNGSRLVIDYQDSWTFTGTVTPDGNANGGYQIEAVLRDYTQYGPAPECEESGSVSIDPGPDNISDTDDDIREEKTFRNMCEVDVETDDNNSNNEDKITGYIGSYHNIGLTTLIVAQGYDSTGNGEATSMRGDQDDIDVGFSRLHATVEHRGSTGTGPYDWEVTFVVMDFWDSNNVVATYTADDCPTGVAPTYSHMQLGEEMGVAEPSGYACASHVFDAGTYKITATVAMVGSSNPDESGVDDSQSATVEARNHDPVISLSISNEGDIVVGDIVSFEVSAFDVEDITGESLTYSWSRVTVDSTSEEIYECNPIADDLATPEDESTKGSRTCVVPVDNTWATTLPVTLMVTDPHGGEASETIDVTVWNKQISTATVASDAVSITYDLTYLAVSPFTIGASDSSAVTGVILGNSEEGSDSVYVIDYAPATTYGAENVGTQTLSITFPGSSTEDYSLWYQYPGQAWTLLDGAAEQDDATNMKLEWTDSTSGTLSGGLLGIFNAAAGDGSVPANGIANAFPVLMAGGVISVQWVLENSGEDLLSSDKVQICTGTTADDCNVVANDAAQYLLQGTHGQVYNVTVSVINVNGANAKVGDFTATADAEVSPAPTTTFGTIANNTDTWTFTITTADAGDATKLYVCWKDSVGLALSTGDLSCVEMDIGDTSVEITKPAVSSEVIYHFSLFAEDASGNEVSLSDTTTQTRYGTIEDPGTGTDTLEDETKGTTGVPTWTWGVIIGIVVVAFGIGAFILSRGGEGGEGSKEWDY